MVEELSKATQVSEIKASQSLAASEKTFRHPPKPHLVFRVGVTGHRTESLEKMKVDQTVIRKTVGKALQQIQKIVEDLFDLNSDVYAGMKPIFRLISPLAEGSDRLVASEAKALGFDLQCPLPFQQAEYQKDFKTTKSLQEFGELLADSKDTIFELDGLRSPDESADKAAYEAVGRVVLRQSDILISIWDGGPSGIGGTGQITREALKRKLPVIWINPKEPDSLRLLRVAPEPAVPPEWDDLKSLPARLKEILSLSSEKEVQALSRFLREKRPKWRLGIWFRIFCKIFYWKWKLPALRINDLQEGSKLSWAEIRERFAGANASVGAQIEQSFRLPFDWADVLAEIYADRYRSSFVATYLFGAFAVMAAFIGYVHWHGWFKVELALISAILALVWLNRTKHWHDRWIDYRLLAEGFRQMQFLAPFARVTPAFEVPAYLGEVDPGPTWFNWYFRAIVREAGLIKAKVDNDYLGVCEQVLSSSMTGQVNYHNDNASRHLHLNHSLHFLTLTLFWTTLLACILHSFFENSLKAALSESSELIVTAFLVGLAVVLPAFGAAIEGINHQGEFERIARRSRAIKIHFDSLVSDLGKKKQISFRELGRIGESFCGKQITEQTDWRSVFFSKDVNPT